MIDVAIFNDTSLIMTTTLRIFNANRSYTGYYWVRLSSDDGVCNTSFTVTTSTYVNRIYHYYDITYMNEITCKYITVWHITM